MTDSKNRVFVFIIDCPHIDADLFPSIQQQPNQKRGSLRAGFSDDAKQPTRHWQELRYVASPMKPCFDIATRNDMLPSSDRDRSPADPGGSITRLRSALDRLSIAKVTTSAANLGPTFSKKACRER